MCDSYIIYLKYTPFYEKHKGINMVENNSAMLCISTKYCICRIYLTGILCFKLGSYKNVFCFFTLCLNKMCQCLYTSTSIYIYILTYFSHVWLSLVINVKWTINIWRTKTFGSGLICHMQNIQFCVIIKIWITFYILWLIISSKRLGMWCQG